MKNLFFTTIKRYALIRSKYGDQVTLKEIKLIDPTIIKNAVENHGSWNKFKKSLGIPTTGGGWNTQKKKDADLIYDLRIYVKQHEKWPWARNNSLSDGFPHTKRTYINHFGSINRAMSICGLKKVGYFPPTRGRRAARWKVIE